MPLVSHVSSPTAFADAAGGSEWGSGAPYWVGPESTTKSAVSALNTLRLSQFGFSLLPVEQPILAQLTLLVAARTDQEEDGLLSSGFTEHLVALQKGGAEYTNLTQGNSVSHSGLKHTGTSAVWTYFCYNLQDVYTYADINDADFGIDIGFTCSSGAGQAAVSLVSSILEIFTLPYSGGGGGGGGTDGNYNLAASFVYLPPYSVTIL